MLGFAMGMITGGIAGFYCRDRIASYLDHQFPTVRGHLADGLHNLEVGTSDALGRLRTTLSVRLRNGEEWVRSGGRRPSNGAHSGGTIRP